VIIKKRELFVDVPCVISKPEREKIDDISKISEKAQERLRKVELEAKELLQKTQLEAEKILNEAQMKAAQIVEDAKKQAENLQKTAENKVSSVEKIMHDFHDQLMTKTQDILQKLLEVVRVLIEKIAYKEIDKIDYQRKLEYILSKIASMNNVKVTMNFSDFENYPEIVEKFKSAGIEISKSDALTEGEIIVETELGLINGTKSYAIEIVEELIEEVFGHE